MSYHVSVFLNVRPFSVKGGRKADLLWDLLYEIGVKDSYMDLRNPKVQFVSTENAVIHKDCQTVVYLALKAQGNCALGIVEHNGWVGPICVDSTGPERDLILGQLIRILYGIKYLGDLSYGFIVLNEFGCWLTEQGYWYEGPEVEVSKKFVHYDLVNVLASSMALEYPITHVIPAIRHGRNAKTLSILELGE